MKVSVVFMFDRERKDAEGMDAGCSRCGKWLIMERGVQLGLESVEIER